MDDLGLSSLSLTDVALVNSLDDKSITWTDISAIFRDSIKELSESDILARDGFQPFELIRTIEIGHPRMDNGTPFNSVNAPTPTIDPLKYKLEDIPMDMLCYIVEGLFIRLISMISRGNLPLHTLFSCAYFHAPEIIADPILKAFVYLIGNLGFLIRRMMMTSPIATIEECHTDPSMHPVFEFGAFEHADIANILQQGFRSLDRKPKDALQSQLLSFLNYFHSFHSILFAFSAHQHIGIEEASKHVEDFICHSSMISQFSITLNDDWNRVFDDTLIFPYLSEGPPRPTQFLSFDECLNFTKLLANDILQMTKISFSLSFPLLIDFTVSFFRNSPFFTRALMCEKFFVQQFPLHYITPFIAIPPSISGYNLYVLPCMRVLKSIFRQLMITFGYNPPFQQRRLRRIISVSFDTLKNHCFQADNCLAHASVDFSFNSYISFVKWQCVCLCVLKGCEMDIYHPREYPSVYFIVFSLTQSLIRLSHFQPCFFPIALYNKLSLFYFIMFSLERGHTSYGGNSEEILFNHRFCHPYCTSSFIPCNISYSLYVSMQQKFQLSIPREKALLSANNALDAAEKLIDQYLLEETAKNIEDPTSIEAINRKTKVDNFTLLLNTVRQNKIFIQSNIAPMNVKFHHCHFPQLVRM